LLGAPIFITGRSSAAATWQEVLLCTNNWLDLNHSWLGLCGREIALFGAGWLPTSEARMTSKMAADVKLNKSILAAAAANDRARGANLDAEIRDKLQRASKAREERKEGRGLVVAKGSEAGLKRRWSPQLGFDEMTADMAKGLVKWVLEAPTTVEGTTKKKKKKRRVVPANATAGAELVNGVAGLTVVEAEGHL
jgi:hypothetical protein